jgi:hypothetical protein
MEIDLRGRRPVLDFDRLYPGGIMPLKVRGVAVAEESEVEVTVEAITPLRINSGSVRIGHDDEFTLFIPASDVSPFVMEIAVDESDIACIPRVYGDRAVLLQFADAVADEDAPTFEHSEMGELSRFVRRVSDRSFLVLLEASTFALTGSFEPIEAVTVEVEEIEEGDDETRAEFIISFSDVPDGGFFRISDSTGSTDKLHYSASAWEIEKALIDDGITGYQVYQVASNPAAFSVVADFPGVVETPEVETRFASPVGFTAELDLSELTLRASLAGVTSETCFLAVKVDGVTVFSDMIPLMRLFDGGLLASDIVI